MELIMEIKTVNQGGLTEEGPRYNEFTMLLDDLLGSTVGIERVERKVGCINRRIYGNLTPLKRRELRKEIIEIGRECGVRLGTYDISIDPERKSKERSLLWNLL